MLFPNGFLFIIAAALASGILTHWLRRKLAAARVMDQPNERSLHAVPVPVGGGIGIWVPVLVLWYLALSHAGHVDQNSPFLFGLVALLIVSWIDDRKPLPASIRFGVHAVAVFFGLWGLDETQMIFQGVLPFWPDRILAGLMWLWFINLTNFMDGIDGISGAHAVYLCAAFVLIVEMTGLHLQDESALALYILGAAAGFLAHNWHPAKIFMGDVGSIPLGYGLGYLMLKLVLAGYLGLALALPLYYVADASFTLIRRVAQKKKFWQAHREHAYQRAALSGASHAKIVIAMIGANALVLGICVISLKSGPIWLALAPLPVAALLWYLERLAKSPK